MESGLGIHADSECWPERQHVRCENSLRKVVWRAGDRSECANERVTLGELRRLRDSSSHKSGNLVVHQYTFRMCRRSGSRRKG